MKTKLLCSSIGVAAVLCAGAARGIHAGSPMAEFTVIDLKTLGGGYSFGYSINDAGVAAGGAATALQTDYLAQTAFISNGGDPVNVGAVGGSACSGCSSEAAAVSADGQVSVISETPAADPDGEDFCGFGTFRQCVAAVWNNHVFRILEMFTGGHNSQVYFANNAGEMVGFSETGQPDNGCIYPFQKYRFQAAKWGRSGPPTPLVPLPGDTVSFAMSINDSGQAVGASGLCSNVLLPPAPGAPHAVFWDVDGTPIDLGTPQGGIGKNVATGINNRGDVVENSHMADGTIHAFVWNRSGGGLRDLGTYPPDAFVTVTPCCNVINNRGQIVGFSVDSTFNLRGLIWRNGVPADLNALLPDGSPWYIQMPGGINEAGEIVASALNLQTSEVHAVLLSPVSGAGPAARGATKPPVLPDSVRQRLQPTRF
jgi:probable HAF family extracellular repeat protein